MRYKEKNYLKINGIRFSEIKNTFSKREHICVNK